MYKNYGKKNIENASFFRLPREICFQINRKRERERERERVREGMKRMREKNTEIEVQIAWKRKNQEDKK